MRQHSLAFAVMLALAMGAAACAPHEAEHATDQKGFALSIGGGTLALVIGEEIRVQAAPVDETGAAFRGLYTIRWTCSPSTVAEITSDGVLTGRGEGSAALTVTATRVDTGGEATATASVSVGTAAAAAMAPQPMSEVPIPVSSSAPTTNPTVVLEPYSATQWVAVITTNENARTNVFTQPSPDPDFDWRQQTALGSVPMGVKRIIVPRQDDVWLRLGSENSAGYAPGKSTPIALGAVREPPTTTPPPPPPPSTIPTVGSLTAEVPFAQMTVGNAQVLGTYPQLATIAEPGVHGTGTVLGSSLRFGRVSDPAGSGRTVFRHALKASDPYTAGNVHRVDVVPPGAHLDKETTYWFAWDMYLPSNTYFANDDTTLVNVHIGPNCCHGNWNMAMNRGKLQMVKAAIAPAPYNTYWTLTETPLADRWIKMVVQFRLSVGSTGFLKVWVDGALKVDDTGPNSIVEGGDYTKVAFYNYSFAGGYGDMSRPEREMFYGVFHTVKDAGYSYADVARLLP